MLNIYTGKRLYEFAHLVNQLGATKRPGWPFQNCHGFYRYEVVERDGEIYPGYKWGIVCKYDNSSASDVSYNGQFGSPRHAAVQLITDLQRLEEWNWLKTIPSFQDALDDIGWPYVRGM